MPTHDFGPGFGPGIERGFEGGFHWFGIVPLLLFAVLIGVIVWAVIRLTREGGATALVGGGGMSASMPVTARPMVPSRNCGSATLAARWRAKTTRSGCMDLGGGPPARGPAAAPRRTHPAGRGVSDAGANGSVAGPSTEGPARVLVVDDEANITDLVVDRLAVRGVRGRRPPHDGRDGARRRRDVPPRPDRARRDAARPRRLRGAAPAARPRAADPGGVPHGARCHRGQGAGAHDRGRRLRHEALQPRGADRPHPHRAAAGPAASAPRANGCASHDLEMDEDSHEVWRGDRPIELTATEFSLLRLPARERPAGAVEVPDPRPRVAVRLRRGPRRSWRPTSATCARRSTSSSPT